MSENENILQKDVILKSEIEQQNELVLKIHNDIDTAQDRLLERARAILSENSIKSSILDKVFRLKRLGFTNTVEVVETDRKIELIEMTENEAKLIEHYKKTYIDLKFLTIKEFNSICDKYNLIYAPVSNYKKDVPEENLIEIESAQPLKKGDSYENMYKYVIRSYWTGVPDDVKEWVNNHMFINPDNSENEIIRLCPIKFNASYLYDTGGFKAVKIGKNDLFIAAPKSHFNLDNLVFDKSKGYYDSRNVIDPKDPIVFRYVKGGIQVLSKWGVESLDQRLNISNIN